MHLLLGIAAREGVADVAQPVGIGRDQRAAISSSELRRAVGLAGFEAAHALAQRLLECAADGHHFAHALHLRAQHRLGAGEFFELPARIFTTT